MKQTDDEILDLVDENDKVIGEVKKSEANRNPKLIHREIAVVVYDQKRRVLFNKRSLNKPIAPGWWTVIGGHILKGEESLTGAHRELLEELGFDTDLVFVEKYFLKRPNETKFIYRYFAKYSGQKINFEKREMSEVKFFTSSDLEKYFKAGEKFGPDSVEGAQKIWADKLVEQ